MRLIQGNNRFVKQVLTINDIINYLSDFVDSDDEKVIIIDVSSLHKNVKLNSLRLAILKEFNNLSVYYGGDGEGEILIVKNIFSKSLLEILNEKHLRMMN